MSAAHHPNGYARVSSREQNLDRQLAALEAFGVERVNVYADKARGVKFGRPRKARPQSYASVREGYLAGCLTRAQAASQMGISISTFDKWLKEDAPNWSAS